MTKVTQWFGPDEKPVHLGCYESSAFGPELADCDTWWDGALWIWISTGNSCTFQDRIWRGLAEKPQP